MHHLVIRNGLKKISISYTKISEEDILRKLNLDGNSKIDLKSFLSKSKQYIEDFTVDAKNNNIIFEKTKLNYYSPDVRESLMVWINHL